MAERQLTVQIPDRGIEYGYTIRDYRVNGLRWSWATEYIQDAQRATEYNYTSTKLGAIFAAHLSLLRLKREVIKKLRLEKGISV